MLESKQGCGSDFYQRSKGGEYGFGVAPPWPWLKARSGREREGQKIQSEREKDGDRDRSAEDYTIFRGIIGTK